MKTQWLVVHDHADLAIYVLESNEAVEGERVPAFKAIGWARKSVTLIGGYYASEWISVNMPNGLVPSFKDEEWAEEGNLRFAIAIAAFGGPMPTTERREAHRKFIEALMDEKESLNLDFRSIREDEEPNENGTPWVNGLMEFFDAYV